MIKCSFDNYNIDVTIEGPWIISECMLLMERVAKRLEKETTVDWRVHLQNMVKVMITEDMIDDDVDAVAKATADGKVYKAPNAE